MNRNGLLKHVGDWITRLGSQSKVAEKCGISGTALSQWMNGKYGANSAELEKRIASTLGYQEDGWQVVTTIQNYRKIEFVYRSNGMAGDHPVLIIDEADKLKPAAFRKLIPLYNRTEHRLGCVLAGTENLHKEIARGVRNNTKGYDEIDSRLGRSYIELPGATEQDVKEICTANGLDDATADRIWNEVDKIKRYVKVTNKRGETKEKNLFFCEDLRRLMRLVKREQIANQFGQM